MYMMIVFDFICGMVADARCIDASGWKPAGGSCWRYECCAGNNGRYRLGLSSTIIPPLFYPHICAAPVA